MGGRQRAHCGQGLGLFLVQDHAPQLAQALGTSLSRRNLGEPSLSLSGWAELATCSLNVLTQGIKGLGGIPPPPS